MRVISSGITDVGRKRKRNEDCFLINDELQLFVVADGMGGHVGGEYASALAVNAMEEHVAHAVGSVTDFDDPIAFRKKGLRAAMTNASRRIYDAAVAHTQYKGMGTTGVAMMLHADRAVIVNVGDSRLYRERDGVFEQVTHDHSLVADAVRNGVLSAEEARHHRQRNQITRALGIQGEVEVDDFEVDAQPGDIFLLCSDGLTGPVDDEEIAVVLRHNAPLPAVRSLVQMACDAGGDDNITAVVVKLEAVD